MDVRSRSHTRRARAVVTTLMLAVLAGCAQDDTVTGPQPAAPLDGAGELQTLESDLDVHGLAASHYADGYVWATGRSIPSYSPNSAYAYNRSGGAITVTRQAEGAYTVRFAGLSAVLGSKSTVHVTGSDVDSTYCKPVGQKLVNDVVHIQCFSAVSGRPTNAFYTVYVTKQYGDLAFAFANLPTGTNYAPPSGASHNPAGAIRVFRAGVGLYTVRFTGLGSRLTSNGGHAQAAAIGTGPQHCKVADWSGTPDLNVTVHCYGRGGVPKDVPFNVFFATPSPNLAYAWANLPTAVVYSPNAFYRSNPTGGGVTITRVLPGRYFVSWSGLALLRLGDVQVTAYGEGNIVCKVSTWTLQGVGVRCLNPSTGTLVDSFFDVMYFS